MGRAGIESCSRHDGRLGDSMKMVRDMKMEVYWKSMIAE